MEFQLNKDDFLQAVQSAQGVADRRATMPILSNVLLSTLQSGHLVVAGTDLQMTVVATVPCEVKKIGSITISAKNLYDIVKSLPSTTVQVKTNDQWHMQITAGKLQYKLTGMDSQDFPRLPQSDQVNWLAVDSAALKDLIRKCLFSASVDEARYHLNGVLVELEQHANGHLMRMVSTDGHRLSLCERVIDKILPGALPLSLLIPRKGLLEVRRLLESKTEHVEMGVFQGHLFFKTGRVLLVLKLSDAKFPPYNQVIPKENNRKISLNKEAFYQSLKRVVLAASDRTYGIKLTLSGKSMRIEADSPEFGYSCDEMEVESTGNDLAIAFNARYLLDVLEQVDAQEVSFELGAQLDPGVIKEQSSDSDKYKYLGVVMPMRL